MDWMNELVFIVTSLLYYISGSAIRPVNPHDFKYIINNPSLCSGTLDLLIWVHSGPANFRRRIALRETWANAKHIPPISKDSTSSTTVIFFLGATTNQTLQSLIRYEAELYKDIIQEDYIDSYRNLTYKAMSGLKWIKRHCNNNIKMILKSDDDMMIYTSRMLDHLSLMTGYPHKPVTSTIICDVWMNRKVERGVGMKWSVSKEEFSRDRYPTYCPGLALLMTPDLVEKLWENALNTQYFWVDDVFFTGLLVEQLNITWVQMGSLFHFGGTLLPRTFISNPTDFIFGHVFSYKNDLFYYLWKRVSPNQDFIS